MTPTNKITVELLESKGACKAQVDLFKSLTVSMTVEFAVSNSSKFNWDWAANNLLSAFRRKAYADSTAPLRKAYADSTAPLRKAYEDARAPLRKAYEDARAPLWKAYEDSTAPLWKAYEDSTAPLWKAYEDARAPLWKAYEDARARSFAELWLIENPQ